MFFMILAIIAKVLLTILKILLFLFVFLVFVIGLILFVPVRYKAAGRYYENEKTFKLRLSWLLHIVSFRVESDGREVSYILRIFGVKVFPGKQKREKKNSVRKKKSKVKKKEKSKQKPVEEKNSEKFETSKAEEENKEKSETLQIEEQRVDSAQIRDNQKKEIKSEQDNKTDKENKFSKNQKEETGKSKKIFDKILTIIKKVSGFFKNLINNIKSLINTAKKMLLAIKAGSEKAKLVKEFVGEYEPEEFLLNPGKPIAVGPYSVTNYAMEAKKNQETALENAKEVILEVAKKFKEISGREYGLFEEYKTKDADYIMLIMGSAAGTAKEAVDHLREQGKKVGVLKLRVFRPFPAEEIAEALKGCKAAAIMDRCESYNGNGGPLGCEVTAGLYRSKVMIEAVNYIYGLAGRDFTVNEVYDIFAELEEAVESGKKVEQYQYIGLRK